jgi:hypothetical protein
MMEPLTDVDVTKSSQALPELLDLALLNLLFLAFIVLVAALLLGVETQVLQKDDLTIASAIDGVLNRLADAVVCEGYALAQQLLELWNNRLETVLGVRLSVRTAEMRHEDDSLGAIVDCVLDCGKGADDALVVGDLLVAVERYVEVDLIVQLDSRSA